MKKYILLMVMLGSYGMCGQLDYTTEQVNVAVENETEQYGAAGYSISTNVAVLADTWTDVPGSFIIPYVSGFDYVTNSTVRYVNGERAFLFGGSASVSSGTSSTYIELGLETNGVYVVGSTTGQRFFSNASDSGSVSYAFPINILSNDTVGLVIKADKAQTVDVNAWQSWALRF